MIGRPTDINWNWNDIFLAFFQSDQRIGAVTTGSLAFLLALAKIVPGYSPACK